MFKRIKLLALLQMSDRFKINKITNKKKLLVKSLLKVLSIAIITAVCSVLLFLLCDIMMIPKNVELLIFIIFISQVLGIVSCAGTLMKALYTSKDNMILLSYPAKHYEVFISKILVFYIYEFLRNLSFVLPLLLGFGIILKIISINFIIATLLMILILPLFPVLIGAIITIPILYFKRFLNRYSAIKFIFIIGIMVGAFVLLVNILSNLPVPLRLVALYHRFMMNVVNFIVSVNKFSLFYTNIGNLLFGNEILYNYLVVLGVLIGMILSVVLISMPLYFHLACKSTEESNVKVHKGKNTAHSNLFFTFVRKEWLMMIRNPDDFINNYIFMFATPYVLYTMVSIFSAVDRNTLGNTMLLGFAGFIALIMSSASNTASAVAISSEGSEFVLLKTSPGKVSNMALAKILFNLVISSVLLFISFLLVSILCDGITNLLGLWIVFGCVVLINIGLILWSFQIDLLSPNLREYATSGSANNLSNSSHSILIGFISSILFTVLIILFLLDDANIIWSYFRIIGISVVFCVLRIYLFISFLNAYFKDIEF